MGGTWRPFTTRYRKYFPHFLSSIGVVYLSPDYLPKKAAVESARRIKRAGGTSREMGGRCAMMPLALLLLPHAALASCDSVGKFVPLDFNTSLVRSNLGGVGGRCSSVALCGEPRGKRRTRQRGRRV